MQKIAEFLNVSADYLMTGKDMEFTVETIDSTQELSEEEYKNACIELFYDDVFFGKENLEGKLVKLHLFVSSMRGMAICGNHTPLQNLKCPWWTLIIYTNTN